MKKILIIEDEQFLLDIMEKKLTAQGYEVAVADDGDEGIVKIKEIKPDLILLDMIMPKKDGFQVLAEMQRDQSLIQIPVIMISNAGQSTEIDRALKMGAKDHLIKTEFDPEEVIVKIKKLLGEKIGEEVKKEKKTVLPGNRILVVEDDKFLRELMVKKLKTEGYETSVAVDGEEALKKTKEEMPSLVLLDINLPGIDGFEVLKQTRKDESSDIKGIPIIILSNLGQSEDIKKAMSLGAQDFLIKAHFTPGEIIEKIKQVLDKR